MGKASKRKSLDTDDDPENVCVLHNNNVKNHGDFVLLNETNYGRIVEIKNKRLKAQPGSVHRQLNICQQIPDEFTPNLGYHRNCYKKFSTNLDRIPINEEDEIQNPQRSPRKNAPENLIFAPDCIFCNKTGHKFIGRYKPLEPLSNFDYGGGMNIKAAAQKTNDLKLLRRIGPYDLSACEAKFHESCRKEYLSRSNKRWRSENEGK